jgi:hypothetical protein
VLAARLLDAALPGAALLQRSSRPLLLPANARKRLLLLLRSGAGFPRSSRTLITNAHHERLSRTLITNANASANARPWGEQLARPRHAAMKRATRDKFSAQEASGKGGAGAAVDLDVDDAGHFREQLGVLQRL